MKRPDKEKEKAERQLHNTRHREKYWEHDLSRLTISKRTHWLCTRGGMLEIFLREPTLLTDEDVMELLRFLFHGEAAQKFSLTVCHGKHLRQLSVSVGGIEAEVHWASHDQQLLALTLNDIDINLGTISVTKTYQRIHKMDVITPPKIPSSIKTVSMPRFLCDELQEYIEMLYEPMPTDRIFKISKSKLSESFHNLTDEAGLKRITVHGLRHSHVSLLISKKYEIIEISKRIGHQ